MRVKVTHNLLLVQKLKTDLSKTLGKNSLEELVRLIQKLAKFVTKNNSKVSKPKTYNEAVNNLINRNKWQKTINKEL